MKKLFFISFSLLILFSTLPISLNAQPGGLLQRILPSGDRNADPNWDWTIDEAYPLYWRTNNFYTARLPYFDNMCPLYSRLRVNNIPDMQKSDGWVLLTRDFGTSGTDNPTYPYFALYNKYRGTIRLFIFIGSNTGNTELYAKMYFPDNYSQNQVTGIFTFSDEKNPYLNDIDKSFTEIFASKNPTFANTWVYADFNAVGYDPNTTSTSKTDVTWAYELYLGNQSFVTLNGSGTVSGMLTEFDLWSSEKKNQQTGQKEVEKTSGNFLLASQNYIGKANDVVNKLRTTAQHNQNTWWAPAILSATTGLSKFLPGAKEALGFITQLFGISSNGVTQPTIPLKWKLDQTLEFQITGQITTNQPILYLEHTIPGAPFTKNSNSTDVPLYRKPLGVFSIEKPTIEWRIVDLDPNGFDCVWDPDGQNYDCAHFLLAGISLQNLPQVTINPNAGITKRFGQVSFLAGGLPILTSVDEQVSDDFFVGNLEVGTVRIFEPYYESMRQYYQSILVDPTQVSIPALQIAYTLYYSPSNNLNDTLQYTRIYPVNVVQNLSNKPSWGCEIVGQTLIKANVAKTWTANVRQGIGPYTYKWYKNGVLIGTNNTVTTSSPKSSFTLSLEVKDQGRNNQSFTTSKFITVDYSRVIIPDPDRLVSGDQEGLLQNHPNPFNPSTQINYNLSEASNVRLTIYNILGEEVIELINNYQEPGQYSISWNGVNSNNLVIAGGCYIMKLQTDNNIYTKKMLFLK